MRKRVIYRCIHGTRSAANPCKAILKVDFIDNTNFIWHLEREHNCIRHENIMKKYYRTENEINEKIKELYQDVNNKGSPEVIFNKLILWINNTTPPDQTKNPINILKVRNRVHKLAKLDSQNIISHDNCLTLYGEKFLLFSCKTTKQPIYGFASPFMLNCSNECQVIGIDGTFYTAPRTYYQVCIFLGRTKLMNLPLLYVILPNKKEQTYFTAFQAYLNSLKMHNIKLNNDLKFICDFEVAEINAIQNAFANEYNCIQLCYYHYCKNNYEKMDENAKKNC